MQFKGFTLNPFQVKAARAIEAGKNVLLSAPTGSGKTLVAEYAIDQALRAKRKVIYTSPIKALSNQKFRDFVADDLDVGLQTGDLTLEAGAPLVIMTTEIFRNAVFEDPERFADVDFVIFDEIHFMDDVERGTVWEESLIFAPEHVRFVGLSATISNLEQFGRWIAEIRPHALEVIHSSKRPVPLQQQLFHAATGTFNLAQRPKAIATMNRQAQRNDARGRGRRRGADDGRGRGGGGGRRERGGRPSRGRNDRPRLPHPSKLVLDELQMRRLVPILFFCFSRRECEIKAERNLHRRLLQRGERDQVVAVFDDICEKFELDPDQDPALRAIRQRAVHGLGFHHAGMLPIHKEVVERLFTSGLLKLLFTTETFALGINMPARTVVFDSLRKFDGVSFDYMRARDYMQMAGRAGRQGIDAEGLVVSILDDEALVDAPLSDLFGGKVEPVTSRFNLSYSTIINLYEHMGTELVEAYDRSFAAFQARSGSKKRVERQRSQARAALRARMTVLEEAGYLERSKGLLPRGRIAQQINGYEIQLTELLFDGVLDGCSAGELAAIVASLVWEPRRGPARPSGGREAVGLATAQRAETAVRRFQAIELLRGFADTVRSPDFGLAPATIAWSNGNEMARVKELAGTDAGDVVRTLRMAIQMMRQLRHALSGDYPLIPRLEEAIVRINRDEVDAKRQFELG